VSSSWVKLYHSTLDSAVMQDDWHFRLFIWCLLKANFRAGGFRGNDVSPGQFITGRITGADELNVSPSKFYRGLHTLQDKYDSIRVSTNNKWTTITICNWSTYQANPDENNDEVNNQRTTNEQPADNKRTTSGHNRRSKEGKKCRGEEKTDGSGDDPNSNQIPDQLNTEQFLQAWSDWLTHRTQKKKPLTELQAKKKLAELAEMGSERATAAINHSIGQGWQGIFEPKANQNGQQQSVQSRPAGDPRGNYAAGEEYVRMFGQDPN